MQIKGQSINFSRDENGEKKLLQKLLEAGWKYITISDLPKIFKKIGVKEEKYEARIEDYTGKSITIELLVEESIRVKISRGDMVNPYSMFYVTRNGKEEYYSVEKELKVERIFTGLQECSFVQRLSRQQVEEFLSSIYPKEKYNFSILMTDKKGKFIVASATKIDADFSDIPINFRLEDFDATSNKESWIKYLYSIFGENYKEAHLEETMSIFD